MQSFVAATRIRLVLRLPRHNGAINFTSLTLSLSLSLSLSFFHYLFLSLSHAHTRTHLLSAFFLSPSLSDASSLLSRCLLFISLFLIPPTTVYSSFFCHSLCIFVFPHFLPLSFSLCFSLCLLLSLLIISYLRRLYNYPFFTFVSVCLPCCISSSLFPIISQSLPLFLLSRRDD